MKLEPNVSRLAVVIAGCMIGSMAHAQQQDTEQSQPAPQTQAQAQDVDTDTDTDMDAATPQTAAPPTTTRQAAEQDELQGVEPVVPVGAPAVPVAPVGPAVVPVAPVESFEGVETVTLQTDRGPVVVISYPGTVPSSEYNIDFSALDTDGDGYISRAEVNATANRSGAAHNLNLEFEVADKNGDGKLAFTEIIQWVY